MITEDYVSFKTAKLLKEKGFNECCRAFRSPSGKLFYSSHDIKNFEDGKTIGGAIAAPTLQMAMKWLRIIHNTNIDIVSVWNQKRFEYQVFVVTPENAKNCYIDNKLYLVHEEAVEAAIIYCLEHLI